MIDHDSDEARLQRHRDACRTVHPDVVDGRRAQVEREQEVRDDIIRSAVMELTTALQYVDRIVETRAVGVSYQTMQRSGFKRKAGWQRAYKMTDARDDAATAAIRLRNAWELLDPISPAKQAEAQRTAISNCQTALPTAIGHLQAVLVAPSDPRYVAAFEEARHWLDSIGSEPT